MSKVFGQGILCDTRRIAFEDKTQATEETCAGVESYVLSRRDFLLRFATFSVERWVFICEDTGRPSGKYPNTKEEPCVVPHFP
eukprot:9503797-Pyramimonas_sp.AAC.1